MDSKKLLMALAAAMTLALATATAAFAVGGPVILGGDDQTDHGGFDSGTQEPEDGWIYIDKAIGNIKPKVGRSNDGSVAAIGSYNPTTWPGDDENAGKAIQLAASRNGMTVRYFGGPSEVQQAFSEISAGTYRPAIIWISGDQAENDLGDFLDEPDDIDGMDCVDDDTVSPTEGEVLAANAQVINAFVNQGGGLMSHGICYPWLSALLPGLIVDANTGEGGSDTPLFLTSAGQAAFPGLTNEMISSGPWHNWFEGDLGGLDVLAVAEELEDPVEGAEPPFRVIIGGGQVSFTEKPTDLAITKADSSDPSTAGRDLTYTLTIANNGGNPATGVTVVDDLPAGLSARSSSASQGSCSGTATVTCSLGDLAVGASATVRIVVRPSGAGTITNRARVSGNQPDPSEGNNSASENTTISAARAARRDRSAPRVIVAGVARRGCVRRAFRAKFRIREANLRSVSVFLDGKRVVRTSKKLFSVRVPANRMKAGRHRLRVVAVDRSGNRRSLTRVFARCAQARAPVFTG